MEKPSVDITAALAAELTLLTQDLDIPPGDLEQALHKLICDTRIAVDSFLGLSVTLTVGRQEVTLDALKPGVTVSDIGTTLRMPLDLASPEAGRTNLPADPRIPTNIVVSMYAGTPGAFVDLAADLAWASGRDAESFVLDGASSTGHQQQKVQGLQDLSDINQAVGMLIDQGRTPEQARTELESTATSEGITVPAAARKLLATSTRRRHETPE